MLRFLFLFLLLTCFNTFTFADDKAENKDADKYRPLVYDKENTADIYPRSQMKAFEELPSIPELPDPFAWADGSGRSTDFMDWERHRSEIMQMLYQYPFRVLGWDMNEEINPQVYSKNQYTIIWSKDIILYEPMLLTLRA